jgi:hypothetical protein
MHAKQLDGPPAQRQGFGSPGIGETGGAVDPSSHRVAGNPAKRSTGLEPGQTHLHQAFQLLFHLKRR